jgi:Icc-related predicted phosphoesterase
MKKGGKTVVITHHLPSRRLVSARFWPKDGSDGANGGFVGDCDNIIALHEPNLWIHGHTHDTIDTELWKTRIICNPAGYRGEWASPFNTYMTTDEKDGKKFARTVPKFVALEDL